MIRIHILGAGGAVPTASHTPAAYFVQVDTASVLLDPGPGALVRLVKADLAPAGVDDIGLVLLSHLHPDHSGDLVALLFALHSPVPTSEQPLYLYGPPGLAALLDKLRGIYGRWLEPRKRALIVRELAPGDKITLGDAGSVTTFKVNHEQDRLAEYCLGFRFVDGNEGTAVYSGDTGPCPELEAAAQGVDLLVVECSTPDDMATAGHMTPQTVGALCAAARPRQVVLTHLYPPAAELDLVTRVAQHFDGDIAQAQDGDVFTVPGPCITPPKETA